MRWVLVIVILLSLASPAAASDDDIGLLRGLGVLTRDGWPSAAVTLPDGSAVFAADDGVHGRELWRTDGTAAGTQLVADLRPGLASSAPYNLDVVGGLAYFFALDPDGSRGVWRSDGTAAGTRKLADVSAPATQAKAASDTPGGPFHPLGGEAVFLVTHYEGFYIAAVGPDGGARVLDVLGPGEWNDLTLLGSTGEALFFRRGGKLYRSDGTRAGTSEIAVDHSIFSLVAVGRHAVISGWSFEREYEVSTLAPDATRATVLARGTTVGDAIAGGVYFSNAVGVHRWAPGEPVRTVDGPGLAESSFGPELELVGDTVLWTTRGQYGATQLYSTRGGILDVHAFDPVGLTPIGGGRALFHAQDDRVASPHHALWVTDGTAAGTRRLTEPTGIGLFGIGLTRNGPIFTDYTRQGDIELFRTDGTPEGTGLLADLNRVPVGSGPTHAARVGDKVVFRTFEHAALWTTDGTAAGTTQLPLGTVPYGIASDGRTAFLGGHDGGLYRTDGTPGGTAKVLDAGLEGWTFNGLGRVGGAFVFSASQVNDRERVWRTDGSAAGTRTLDVDVITPVRLVAAGARTLLFADFYRLLRTDGTSVSPVAAQPPAVIESAVAVDDGFLAAVGNADVGSELFHLDADGGEPRLVADIVPGGVGSLPRAFAKVGDRVVFTAGRDGFENRWYVSDGRSANRLGGVTGFAVIQRPVTIDGVAYLVTTDGYDALLYRTDGTEAGTILLHRFPGAYDTPPALFTAFNGTTWFAAAELEHGRELWRTDGTPAGTRLARDIRPGRSSSDPLDLVATDDFLFFTAFDDVNGAEPWRIRRAAPPAEPPAPEPPPVTIAPIAPTPAPLVAPTPTSAAKATVTVRVERLRKLRGRTRWRVSGVTTAGACGGPVKIVLGRRNRALKTTRARLIGCRYRIIVSTTSRSSGRWLEVRTVVPGVVSQRTNVR